MQTLKNKLMQIKEKNDSEKIRGIYKKAVEKIANVAKKAEELREFEGIYPGQSNLRDLGNVDKFGKRFVKHSGPINLALFNLTQKDYNSIDAIKFAGLEYIKFKREE